jgi:shikimate dehydrogenase
MKKLSGHTVPFAVLGHPIGHSLSPVMHNASIESLGMDAIYLAFDVHPDRLMQTLHSMREMGFKGVNLTVPLKETAFRGLEHLADSARLLGAVNTVEFLDSGELRGHNTDGSGFLQALQEDLSISPAGKHVFVLGSGGAGRATALTCAVNGAARVTVADIDGERAKRLADELAEAAPQCIAELCTESGTEREKICVNADIVVQATPVGMKPTDQPVLGPAAFRQGQSAFDLIYMYPETGFMKSARAGGADAANGLGMLLHQGAAAFKIWTGIQPDTDAMCNALKREVYG